MKKTIVSLSVVAASTILASCGGLGAAGLGTPANGTLVVPHQEQRTVTTALLPPTLHRQEAFSEASSALMALDLLSVMCLAVCLAWISLQLSSS